VRTRLKGPSKTRTTRVPGRTILHTHTHTHSRKGLESLIIVEVTNHGVPVSPVRYIYIYIYIYIYMIFIILPLCFLIYKNYETQIIKI